MDTVAGPLGLLLLATPLAGCTDGDAKDVVAVWRLIDGRSCVDTAVVQVTIDVEGGSSASGSASGLCHSQASGNRIALSGIKPGAKLHVKARSGRDAVLYRADYTAPDPVLPTIDLPLYYTGGE
jgi:hypothetical protein